MKKLLLVLLLPMIFGCAFTGQQKAEKLIKKYLDSSLNDPHSYEPISFGKLDTIYSPPIKNKLYKNLEEEIFKKGVRLLMLEKYGMDSVAGDKGYRSTNYDADLLHLETKSIREDSVAEEKKIDSLTKKIKQSPYIFQMTHTYRAKNGFGALIASTSTFFVTQDFKQVVIKKAD
jgi:hypothetical protein